MSLTGTYDDQNVFAKILRGEAPAVKLFETDKVLAFMDLFPQSEGHALVISRTSRARNILDVEPPVLAELIAATQKLTRAVTTALNPDGVMVAQFNGAVSGQTVFHLHFHVIPRYAGKPMGRHGEGAADIGQLTSLAARITAALTCDS